MSFFRVSAVLRFMGRIGGIGRVCQLLVLLGLLQGGLEGCKPRRPDPKLVNGPNCVTFTNKTFANGLEHHLVHNVYTVGNTVYAATYGGLSISNNGGNTFINKTTANRLGSNIVRKVYGVGNNVYAATGEGLSISTDGGNTFTNRTTANGLGNDLVRRVYVLGNTIYAATNGGLSVCS